MDTKGHEINLLISVRTSVWDQNSARLSKYVNKIINKQTTKELKQIILLVSPPVWWGLLWTRRH